MKRIFRIEIKKINIYFLSISCYEQRFAFLSVRTIGFSLQKKTMKRRNKNNNEERKNHHHPDQDVEENRRAYSLKA